MPMDHSELVQAGLCKPSTSGGIFFHLCDSNALYPKPLLKPSDILLYTRTAPARILFSAANFADGYFRAMPLAPMKLCFDAKWRCNKQVIRLHQVHSHELPVRILKHDVYAALRRLHRAQPPLDA